MTRTIHVYYSPLFSLLLFFFLLPLIALSLLLAALGQTGFLTGTLQDLGVDQTLDVLVPFLLSHDRYTVLLDTSSIQIGRGKGKRDEVR